MARKKLPIGIQTFSKIREGGYYYVDKTAFIARLVDEGSVHHFLSRPRRFGKSLFVSTLKALFEGKKDMFEGLYIHDKWDWGVECPVLRLDFSGATFKDADRLERNVAYQLRALERRWGVKSDIPDAQDRFGDLIKRLAGDTGQRVVVLVDEYDKPILDALDRPGLEGVARENLDYLRGLYSNLKHCEDHIRFSFLTGVSKFSRAGIFSGLNNLRDITLKPEFSSICGYTENDLDTVFAQELKGFDREKIKTWYNGYSWRGEEKVYNPFSILLLFDEREFGSWWFDTGTPSFLIEVLKKQREGLGTLGLEGMSTNDNLLSAFDIGNMEVEALLFQTGYLTIAREEQGKGGTRYILDYPNLEVRQSLNEHLLRALTKGIDVDKLSGNIRKALLARDAEAMKTGVHALFSGIANSVYTKNNLNELEAHYASVLYACFEGAELDVHAEDPTNHGYIDMTVETDAAIYVFEFKVLKGSVKRGAALKQIRKRGYADKFLGRGVPVYLVGMEFSPKDRNIKYLDIEPIRGRRTSGRKKATRKKTTRKRGARKTNGRKKSTRKKTAGKKGAKKKTTRKKSGGTKRTRKKTTRKKSAVKKSARKKATRKKRKLRR